MKQASLLCGGLGSGKEGTGGTSEAMREGDWDEGMGFGDWEPRTAWKAMPLGATLLPVNHLVTMDLP